MLELNKDKKDNTLRISWKIKKNINGISENNVGISANPNIW